MTVYTDPSKSYTLAVPMSAGLTQRTYQFIVSQRKHPGMIMCSSSTIAEYYFNLFDDHLRVLAGPSLAVLTNKADRAVAEGTPYEILGYGLEQGHSTPPEEYGDPLAATEDARDIADAYGKLLMMAPGYKLMNDNLDLYDDMAALSDYWMFQTQQVQKNYDPGSGYAAQCQTIVNLIRAGNPTIPIWAQITFPPTEIPPIPSRWLAYRESIIDIVDGTHLGAYIWALEDEETTLAAMVQVCCSVYNS